MATEAPRRRRFLASAAAGSAALAGALVVRDASSPPAEPSAKARQDGAGYRLSAHVERYYRTART